MVITYVHAALACICYDVTDLRRSRLQDAEQDGLRVRSTQTSETSPDCKQQQQQQHHLQ